ncbi:MAG: TonB-dependent receptor, partial [Gammaproteobacteria bacterium]
AAGGTAADDLTGEPRADSPENKFNIGTQYTWPLGAMGQLVARIDHTWSDDRLSLARVGEVPDYSLTSARLAWFSADAHWELALWGNNLGDEEVITLYGNGEAVNSTPGWRLPPRMWGVDVIYSL